MWVFDTTLYQMYPLGMLGCPFDAPAVDDAEGQERERSLHRVRSLIEWAPYLGELGVSAILLNPVFASDTHGYNTRDLRQVDCRLGTNEDFAHVVDALHACGVRVIVDAVLNHVGRNFWAFRDVRERKWGSPYKDWFNISFDGDTHFGDGFWYEGWEGNQDLVKLNLRNPEVIDHLLDTVRMWKRELGVDGLRLDVAYSLDRDFVKRLHGLARELGAEPRFDGTAGDGFPLIGEVLHGDYNLIVNDEMLDSCTNYECYKGLYSSFNSMNMFEIAHSLHRQFGGDPWCIYRGKHLVNFADNHDVSRLARILTEKRHLAPAYGVLFGHAGHPMPVLRQRMGAAGRQGHRLPGRCGPETGHRRPLSQSARRARTGLGGRHRAQRAHRAHQPAQPRAARLAGALPRRIPQRGDHQQAAAVRARRGCAGRRAHRARPRGGQCRRCAVHLPRWRAAGRIRGAGQL